MSSARPRVLLAITVYNGRAFVPRCLTSAKGLETPSADVDVLVLDDCSPEPGFSEMIAEQCKNQGIYYYRTPRNLGIVRNVNMGLLAAVEKGYDYVIISNSDVIYSKQTVEMLLAAARSSPRIGSVTAWSNNVSIFSLPNVDPDKHLASQGVVDWLSSSLDANFRGTAVDIPAGISFSILIPTPVIRDVGLMDPVFGRGYCEETDWTLRSLAKGYRITLAPAAFVYHQGRGSTLAAGMVSGGHSTVPANENVIDYRYPLFRNQVDAFVRSGILDQLRRDALAIILRQAARQYGYRIEYNAVVDSKEQDMLEVTCRVRADTGSVLVSYKGFELELTDTRGKPLEAAREFFQAPAADGSSPAGRSDTLPIPLVQPPGRPSYPVRV
ncbi:MAG TPA: glycosyltransferase family 2 protein [Myxococcaceae bacterium]|jgi:GT2 family glycosyltransferase